VHHGRPSIAQHHDLFVVNAVAHDWLFPHVSAVVDILKAD